MPLMQSITDQLEAQPFLRQMDITAPEGDVEIQIRGDGSVLWVHVEGVTVLRICRISGKIKINDSRPDYDLIQRLRLVPPEVLKSVIEKINASP